MRLLRPIATAFAFLTRFPVGAGAAATASTPAELAGSLPWFPVVGAALGSVLVGAARLLEGRLPAGLVALALVAVLALLTGGLHLDGLADLFDALGGGRGDRARMLDIMRDSRIGAHGAAALFVGLGAKTLALAALVQHGALWPIFVFPAAARWAVLPLVVFFPYARAEGLGRAFNGHGRAAHVAAATVLTITIGAAGGARLLAPAGAAAVAALALGLAVGRRLGGLTGDVYGAAIELAEVAFLVASIMVLE